MFVAQDASPDLQRLEVQRLRLVTPMQPFIGPGYYVVHDTSDSELGGAAFDYTELPADRAEGWLAENAPAYMRAKPTGASVMFSHISQRNIESMLRGNLLAVILIAGIMVLSLRSLSLGALSMIPNAVPILMTFGIWALTVGQVGMAAATVSATSLGIIVDNTVHFMTKYLRARRERGFDQPEAIRYAFRTVGAAIAANAVILALGFAVLAASTFRINAEMGLLTALAIVIALAVDFLLLPALLLIGHRKEKVHVPAQTHVNQTV